RARHVHRLPGRRRRFALERRRERQVEVTRQERVSFGEHHRPLDAVLQLADVAGPAVALQLLERLGRDDERLLLQIAAETIDEIPREDGDIALTLAKRRDGDREDGEAE